MEIERELKYSTTDEHVPSVPELEAVLEGAGLTLSAPTVERYSDVYFDTPEGAVRQAGGALRKRHRPGASYATYKGSTTLKDDVHARPEIELPLTDAGSWPQDVLAALPPGVQLDDLIALAELNVRRVRIDVSEDGEVVAELAFDEVICSLPDDPEASVTFYEVEVEAGRDDPRLEHRMRRVAEAVGELVPLTPSSFSKLERSLALLSMFAPD